MYAPTNELFLSSAVNFHQDAPFRHISEHCVQSSGVPQTGRPQILYGLWDTRSPCGVDPLWRPYHKWIPPVYTGSSIFRRSANTNPTPFSLGYEESIQLGHLRVPAFHLRSRICIALTHVDQIVLCVCGSAVLCQVKFRSFLLVGFHSSRYTCVW